MRSCSSGASFEVSLGQMKFRNSVNFEGSTKHSLLLISNYNHFIAFVLGVLGFWGFGVLGFWVGS